MPFTVFDRHNGNYINYSNSNYKKKPNTNNNIYIYMCNGQNGNVSLAKKSRKKLRNKT